MVWVLLILLGQAHLSYPGVYVFDTKEKCLELRKEIFEEYKEATNLYSNITLTSEHGMSRKFRCITATKVQ